MAEEKIRCCCCHRLVPANPRVKNQRYCGDDACQKHQRKQWLKSKTVEDEEYRTSRLDWQQRWAKGHPGYWRQWRKDHPEYVARNRILQSVRNKSRLCKGRDCKDESLQPKVTIDESGIVSSVIAKYESLEGRIEQVEAFIRTANKK